MSQFIRGSRLSYGLLFGSNLIANSAVFIFGFLKTRDKQMLDLHSAYFVDLFGMTAEKTVLKRYNGEIPLCKNM